MPLVKNKLRGWIGGWDLRFIVEGDPEVCGTLEGGEVFGFGEEGHGEVLEISCHYN